MSSRLIQSRGHSIPSAERRARSPSIGMNGVGHTPSGMRGASSIRTLNSVMFIKIIL